MKSHDYADIQSVFHSYSQVKTKKQTQTQTNQAFKLFTNQYAFMFICGIFYTQYTFIQSEPTITIHLMKIILRKMGLVPLPSIDITAGTYRTKLITADRGRDLCND